MASLHRTCIAISHPRSPCIAPRRPIEAILTLDLRLRQGTHALDTQRRLEPFPSGPASGRPGDGAWSLGNNGLGMTVRRLGRLGNNLTALVCRRIGRRRLAVGPRWVLCPMKSNISPVDHRRVRTGNEAHVVARWGPRKALVLPYLPNGLGRTDAPRDGHAPRTNPVLVVVRWTPVVTPHLWR